MSNSPYRFTMDKKTDHLFAPLDDEVSRKKRKEVGTSGPRHSPAHHSSIPPFQHHTIPAFQHSNTPTLQHSSIPTLQSSTFGLDRIDHARVVENGGAKCSALASTRQQDAASTRVFAPTCPDARWNSSEAAILRITPKGPSLSGDRAKLRGPVQCLCEPLWADAPTRSTCFGPKATQPWHPDASLPEPQRP